MSIRSLIIATAGVAVLAAGAASAQPVASHPVPNPTAHKTVIVTHRHGHKIVRVVHHHRHHGHHAVVRKDILVNKK